MERGLPFTALYRECLDSLEVEPEVEHLKRRELDRELWGLVCDLSVEQAYYRQQVARKERWERFLSAVTKPHEDFEVICPIEGLVMGKGEITVGNVNFCRFDGQKADSWDVTEGFKSYFPPAIFDQTVGLSSVKAGSPTKAIERAKEEIDTALNILRVCMASSRHPYFLDEQLLQRRSGLCVAKSLNPSPAFHVELTRGFENMGADLGKKELDSISELATRFQPLYDGTVQGRLANQLLRALEWIGTSITREHYDDKVVDLCTALECLLTRKDDGAKGEAITLRVLLLAFVLNLRCTHPAETYRFYELRSDIVHGSALRVCGKSDYQKLRNITLTTLDRVLELVAQDKSITQLKFLIDALERAPGLEVAGNWLEKYNDGNSRKVADYVRNRLKQES